MKRNMRLEKNVKEYCAPIIIPTLCRLSHLKKCIESLQKNVLAEHSELYISVDFPLKAEQIEGNNAIKHYIECGISGFKNVVYYFQSENLGIVENEKFLITEVYKKYDTYIYTEDDNVFAPCALEFLNEGLREFREDEKIISICAKGWGTYNQENQENVYLLQRFTGYGYATWKYKEHKFLQTIHSNYFYEKMLHRKERMLVFNNGLGMLQAYTSILLKKDLICFDKKGRIAPIDTTWALYMILGDYYALFPRSVIVRNYGYDGSGTNCKELTNVIKLPLGNDKNFEYKYIGNCPSIESNSMKNTFKENILKHILYLEIIIYNWLGNKWYQIMKQLIKR